ncbi:MAG: GTP cyclohydrolase II [Deltaproteobacteria bacterium]|nr:GTP cyclohydrolase II [Deltaproteobacteria bacterium]
MSRIHEDPSKAVDLFAKATIPTKYGAFQVRVFVDRQGKEHLAVTQGELAGGESVLTRVHSECLTGEVLGSLKCDCREQLDEALARVADVGRGVVVYLRQEGRGIGLGNKIRAYALQERGADTVEANRMLGYADDLRDYGVAADILRALGVKSVILLTNNPLKVEGLEKEGVAVARREPLVVSPNAHNEGYLATKASRMGHEFD